MDIDVNLTLPRVGIGIGMGMGYAHSTTHFASTNEMLLTKHVGIFCVRQRKEGRGGCFWHWIHTPSLIPLCVDTQTFTTSFPLSMSFSQSHGSRCGITADKQEELDMGHHEEIVIRSYHLNQGRDYVPCSGGG
jgi:hypothetical protein